MTRLARAVSRPSSWPLLCGLCLATWLAGLALALPWGTRAATQHWEGQLDDLVMIALPPSRAEGGRDGTPSLARTVAQTLTRTFPGTGVTPLPVRDVEQTLARWSTPWSGPLPALITLHYHGNMPALAALVRKDAPDAAIIPPPRQQEALAPLLASLHHASRMVAWATGTAASLIILALLHLAIRTTILANTRQLALLPELGGSPAALYHVLARHMALIAGLGSLAGLAILLPTLALLAAALRPLLHMPPLPDLLPALLPHGVLPQALLTTLCLLPVLMAMLGWVMVQLVCRLQGRTSP